MPQQSILTFDIDICSVCIFCSASFEWWKLFVPLGELWYTGLRENKAVTAMCAKKKAVPSKMWRIAGEPVRSQPLSAAEQEAFSEEFSIYRQFRSGTKNGLDWVTPAAARLHQSAAMAVAAPLCERYAGTYGRKAVVKVVSATAAIPAPLSVRMARRADFLLGGALWVVD